MRKLTAFLTLICTSLSVYAQSSFVPGSDTVMVSGSADQEIIQATLSLTNTSSVAREVMVERHEISVVSGTENYFCWVACYPPFVNVSPSPDTIAAGAISNKFYADLKPHGTTGLSTIKYCFYDQDSTADSVCVVINFDVTPVGIDKQTGKKSTVDVYPNPVSSNAVFKYAMEKEVNDARITVFSVLGEKVQEIKLEGNANLAYWNTDGITPGIYFYAVTSGNRSLSGIKRLVIAN